jgi:hypothetical protein
MTLALNRARRRAMVARDRIVMAVSPRDLWLRVPAARASPARDAVWVVGVWTLSKVRNIQL